MQHQLFLLASTCRRFICLQGLSINNAIAMASDLSELLHLKWTALIYMNGLPLHGSQWTTSSNILSICLSCIIALKKMRKMTEGPLQGRVLQFTVSDTWFRHSDPFLLIYLLLFYSLPHSFQTKEACWIKYMFRGKGLSHYVKYSHSVHRREALLKTNLLQYHYNAIFISNPIKTNGEKLFSESWISSDLLIRVNVAFLMINMNMRTLAPETP